MFAADDCKKFIVIASDLVLKSQHTSVLIKFCLTRTSFKIMYGYAIRHK